MHSTRALLLFLPGVLFLDNALANCVNRENTSIPISTPTSAFNVLGAGTVIDTRTGLMWMRCLVGQTLNGNTCSGNARIFTWAEGLTAAAEADFAGHDDWRLPNPKELLSIMEDRCYSPSLNGDLFPIRQDFGAWSSTPTANLMTGVYDQAWVVDSLGYLIPLSKNQLTNILLVRKAP